MNLDEVFHEGAERDVQILLACHGRVREVLTAVWDKCNKVLDRVFSRPDSYVTSDDQNETGSEWCLVPEPVMPADLQVPDTFKELMANPDLIGDIIYTCVWEERVAGREPVDVTVENFRKNPYRILLKIIRILTCYFSSNPELAQQGGVLLSKLSRLSLEAEKPLNVRQIESRFSLLGIDVEYLTGLAFPNGGMKIKYAGRSADMSPEYFDAIAGIREFEMLIIENAVKQGRLKPLELYEAMRYGYPPFNDLIGNL